MSADLHTLTGAYAVNALPEDERREFERHLTDCAVCRREVAELRTTAARLGMAAAQTPPPELRGRVLGAIDSIRQEPPTVTPLRPRRSPPRSAATERPWLGWLGAAAASILAVAAIFLGGLTASLNHRTTQLEAANQQLVQVLAAPDATIVPMQGPEGATSQVVLSHSRGQAIFVASGMPAVSDQQIYELWLLRGDQAVPAGLVRPDQDGRAHHVLAGDLDGVTAIAVTIEPAGGSPQPTSDPVMVAQLEA